MWQPKIIESPENSFELVVASTSKIVCPLYANVKTKIKIKTKLALCLPLVAALLSCQMHTRHRLSSNRIRAKGIIGDTDA
jgi:hypothetical protein